MKMSLTDEEGFFPVSKTLEGAFFEADRLWKPILGTQEFHVRTCPSHCSLVSISTKDKQQRVTPNTVPILVPPKL